MHKLIEVQLSFPDEESAKTICHTLVTEKLSACANLFPIYSIYPWEGQIQQEGEWQAHLKTLSIKLDLLLDRIKALHPYQVPAILWWEIDTTGAYASWVREFLLS